MMAQRHTDPTLDEIQSIERPVLVEKPLAYELVGHRPVLRDGELDAACDANLHRLQAVDHIDVRKTHDPCSSCFPDGFPFTYVVEEIGPYTDLESGETLSTEVLSVPREFLPDGEVWLGGRQ